MRTLLFSLIGAFSIVNFASAQESENEQRCLHIESEIAILEQSISGLSRLLGGNDLALLQCDVDNSMPYTYSRDKCLERSEVQGIWTDFETRTTYLVYSRDYIRSYAQNVGASQADLQRSFAASDGIENKIRGGGVIPGLQSELAGWRDEYARACAKTNPVPVDPNNCLLGICPD